VPVTTYEKLGCDRIVKERNEVVRQVNAASGAQKEKSDNMQWRSAWLLCCSGPLHFLSAQRVMELRNYPV
jgi:hypothetical protein